MNDKLKAFYNKIPAFKCIPGCTDCCGPVPFSKSEWEAIKDKRGWDINKGIMCPYANSGCDIYDQRPLICRIFGAADHPMLKCPRGCGPKRKLTAKMARKIMNEYHEMMGE